MSINYGLKPKFDVKENPIYDNIKLIAEKAKEYGKIAGIHNGTSKYAKEMIDVGFQLVTISSDFRAMTSGAQKVIDEILLELETMVSDSNRAEMIAEKFANEGYAVLVKDSHQAMKVANSVAPEHLQLMTSDPTKLLDLLQNAGAVFLGTKLLKRRQRRSLRMELMALLS